MEILIVVQAWHSPPQDGRYHVNADCKMGNPETRIPGTGGPDRTLCNQCSTDLEVGKCVVQGRQVGRLD